MTGCATVTALSGLRAAAGFLSPAWLSSAEPVVLAALAAMAARLAALAAMAARLSALGFSLAACSASAAASMTRPMF
jgi:hypothetical protein